jgi:hypothetical protein
MKMDLSKQIDDLISKADTSSFNREFFLKIIGVLIILAIVIFFLFQFFGQKKTSNQESSLGIAMGPGIPRVRHPPPSQVPPRVEVLPGLK